MKQSNKWTVKDVITTVLLTVVLVLIQLIINMVGMVNNFFSMVLSVGITMLVCAPVYFLMVSRVRKHFVSLIYMTILGIIFLLMGNWYLLPYYILVGVICEIILWKNGWESKKKMTAAWTAASLLYNGVNLLPLWFFWDTYYDFAMASGMEQSYVDAFVSYYTSEWLIFIIIFTTVCGFVGSLIGGKLIDKHFKKAGVL
ncbi:MAG: MptD family putative ECF transporter S component [Clostridiales bacterium]|nr:MptD family putative ECF transporter S component [Clostridiales bacterium]